MQVHEAHELQIISPHPRYGRVALAEPTTLGYILVTAEVQPRPMPFMPNSREKAALLKRLSAIARQIEQLDAVERITLFDAVAFAPPTAYVKERQDSIYVARFDVVALIETQSPEMVRDVQTTPAYQALIDALGSNASRIQVINARNTKRIADVDKTRKGVFLFNYFVGDDADVVLELWDYLADWYRVETGLDNSTLLVPQEGDRSDYMAVNSARWDGSVLGIVLRQLSKPTFRSYVLGNMKANQVGAMPVLYRLADRHRGTGKRAPMMALAAAVVAGAVALGVGLVARQRRHV